MPNVLVNSNVVRGHLVSNVKNNEKQSKQDDPAEYPVSSLFYLFTTLINEVDLFCSGIPVCLEVEPPQPRYPSLQLQAFYSSIFISVADPVNFFFGSG